MNNNLSHLDAIKDIKQMMEKSSRFISLSGLSGISAGVCALVGAVFAYPLVGNYKVGDLTVQHMNDVYTNIHQETNLLGSPLLRIALLTFLVAFVLAFFFTYLRSKKTNTPLWGTMARKVMTHVAVPMIAGGILILQLIEQKAYTLIAPACLIFYGLALINASKFTLVEINYLGYAQLILGLISLWFPGASIYFWAAGFGVFHIIYGGMMWYKYERE